MQCKNLGTEGVRSGEGASWCSQLETELQTEGFGQSPLWHLQQSQAGAGAASVRMREAAGRGAFISPGGKAHSVQAEGKMDFCDPSPVFQQSPFLALYVFF